MTDKPADPSEQYFDPSAKDNYFHPSQFSEETIQAAQRLLQNADITHHGGRAAQTLGGLMNFNLGCIVEIAGRITGDIPSTDREFAWRDNRRLANTVSKDAVSGDSIAMNLLINQASHVERRSIAQQDKLTEAQYQRLESERGMNNHWSQRATEALDGFVNALAQDLQRAGVEIPEKPAGRKIG